MRQLRILTIQDVSCLGQCSMTVALPVLSACGHETCVLPTMLLSTHTGGFGRPEIVRFSDRLAPIIAHWKENQITFDAVLTGYLGSAAAIETAETVLKTMLAPGGLAIVDPAMADNGKLYSGFDEAYVEKMKGLCAQADFVLPNLTEAALLTDEGLHFLRHVAHDIAVKAAVRQRFDNGEHIQTARISPVSAFAEVALPLEADLPAGLPWEDRIDAAYGEFLLKRLNLPRVLLTGVGEQTSGFLLKDGERFRAYSHPRLSGSFSGTGDLFAAAFTGLLASGKDVYESGVCAANFTCKAIARTAAHRTHWYGLQFEPVLPELMAMCGREAEA